MKKIHNDFPAKIIAFLCCIGLAGCLHIRAADVVERAVEVPKIILGNSTKALEEARGRAVSKVYQCAPGECFDKVAEIAKDKSLEVFIRNKQKMQIVLMDLPGTINTTEVGVFFAPVDEKKTKVEIVSLSLSTQETAANLIFPDLKMSFSEE